MAGTSRKIAYLLGAGFAYGCNHFATVGRHQVHMPLQLTLFEELCRFHHKKITRLDSIAKLVRKYFSPQTYRATRGKGSARHKDLFGLSVEEVVTFFDEIAARGDDGAAAIAKVAAELQRLTVELVGFLSRQGSPGQNKALKRFARRLAQTDVVITFNWDTILDRVLANQHKYGWHPSWGYGKTVRKQFRSVTRSPPPIPKKYPRLLKLHGSANWLASKSGNDSNFVVTNSWSAGEKTMDAVMMPPKMIKLEILGRQLMGQLSTSIGGNSHVPERFYPSLWKEAEAQLSSCRRLVVIGYSFPPADFAVGNMLRRAISLMKARTGDFPVVEIVDPNAAELARRFEQSFKISVPVDRQFLSLKNYLVNERAASTS